MYQHRQIALLSRILSLRRIFIPLNFFHRGVVTPFLSIFGLNKVYFSTFSLCVLNLRNNFRCKFVYGSKTVIEQLLAIKIFRLKFRNEIKKILFPI